MSENIASVEELMTNASTVAQIAISQLQGYAVVMASNKRMNIEEGVKHQLSLYRALLSLINNVKDDFKPSFAAALQIIATNRTSAFSELNVLRFGDNMHLNAIQLKCFRNLVHLMITIAPLETRTLMLRQINLDKHLIDPVKEDGKERVIEFLSVWKR